MHAIDRFRNDDFIGSNFSPWHDHSLALVLRAIGADPEHIRHDLLRQRVGGGTLCDEATLRKHQNGIGKSRGKAEIVRDHDHQRALIGGGAQALDDIDLVARIERGRRSSARITGASTANTRASATRLRSPPDNSVTRRSLEFHDIGRRIARSTASASFGVKRDGSVAPCG